MLCSILIACIETYTLILLPQNLNYGHTLRNPKPSKQEMLNRANIPVYFQFNLEVSDLYVAILYYIPRHTVMVIQIQRLVDKVYIAYLHMYKVDIQSLPLLVQYRCTLFLLIFQTSDLLILVNIYAILGQKPSSFFPTSDEPIGHLMKSVCPKDL